jgi:hypothetical protein
LKVLDVHLIHTVNEVIRDRLSQEYVVHGPSIEPERLGSQQESGPPRNSRL